MKIYLLIHGHPDTEDERPIAVFDEEYLEEAATIAKLTDGWVSAPYELNSFPHDEPPPGMSYFWLTMDQDGVVKMSAEWPVLDEGGKLRTSRYDSYGDAVTEVIGGPKWSLMVRTYAPSKERAIEVANELRFRILAGDAPRSAVLLNQGT